MTGSFIVSLDCEGKWGMADAIGPQHDFITRDSLTGAYRTLLDLFDEFGIAATFAFVTTFVHPEPAVLDRLQDSPSNGALWTRHFRAAQRAGTTDGWFCPEALAMTRARGRHEIASHGFSHLPFDAPDTPPEALEAEVALAAETARAHGIALETFVFPRNRVGRLEALRRAGFIGYRAHLHTPGGAPMRLLRELNLIERAQPQGTATEGLVAIPPGCFLNWRQGMRARIPMAATLRRWRSILNDAAARGRVAHLWFHPHNILSAPETLESLRAILVLAAAHRDAGRLRVETQADHARRILAAG